MALEDSSIMVENARILYRNFEGAEGRFNAKGNRNFCLVLPDEGPDALPIDQMIEDGWNVKYLKPRDEADEPKPFISVNVSFRGRPPRIVMITHKGRTDIPEDMVEMLDWADIRTVDVIINPYHWSKGGDSGIKGYLKSMYVTIQDDPLELKYADINEIGGTLEIERPTTRLQITDGADDEILDGELED